MFSIEQNVHIKRMTTFQEKLIITLKSHILFKRTNLEEKNKKSEQPLHLLNSQKCETKIPAKYFPSKIFSIESTKIK